MSKFFFSVIIQAVALSIIGMNTSVSAAQDIYEINVKHIRVPAPASPSSVQEMIHHPRVQLFSIDKSSGYPSAHARLEQMRAQYSPLSVYQAMVVAENGSKWLRGQIGPFQNKAAADSFASTLSSVFTQDKPCPVAAGIISQPGHTLESGGIHRWK